jgi:hypothetical protein
MIQRNGCLRRPWVGWDFGFGLGLLGLLGPLGGNCNFLKRSLWSIIAWYYNPDLYVPCQAIFNHMPLQFTWIIRDVKKINNYDQK